MKRDECCFDCNDINRKKVCKADDCKFFPHSLGPKKIMQQHASAFNCNIKEDVVNHPSHYKGKNGIEVIDIIEGFDLTYCEGNIIKYILRHKKKNGLEDLKKAQWYLNKKIKQMEANHE